MSNTPIARQDQDARQLQRLRGLHERKARQDLSAAEAQLAQAEAAVREREARLEHLQDERDRLGQRIVGELAPRLGRLNDSISAVLAHLDDQLERTEYALMDEEEVMNSARRNVHEKRRQWRRAQARCDAADTLVSDTHKAVLREREQRAEREDTPFSASPLTAVEQQP